jgi:hypothetical protein
MPGRELPQPGGPARRRRDQRQRGDSLGVGCGLGDALDDAGALDAQVVEQANDAIGV